MGDEKVSESGQTVPNGLHREGKRDVGKIESEKESACGCCVAGIGVLGKTERACYDDGGLCYEKSYIPRDAAFPYIGMYDQYGRWLSRSPDGKEEYVIRWPEPTGKWVEWYPNGQKRKVATWVDGQLEGRWQTWHEDGTPDSLHHDKNRREHGQQVIWADNGVKVIEEYAGGGKYSGRRTEWYETGRLRYRSHPPPARSYGPDGRVFIRNPTGPWMEWYANGAKDYQGYYLNGEWHGKWMRWMASGRTAFVEWYDRGEKVEQPSSDLKAWYERVAKKHFDGGEVELEHGPGGGR